MFSSICKRGVRRTSSSIAVPKRGSCAMIASRSSARRLSDMAPINIAATLGSVIARKSENTRTMIGSRYFLCTSLRMILLFGALTDLSSFRSPHARPAEIESFIVRADKDSLFSLPQNIQQMFHTLRVKMIRRLIQNQQLRLL